MKTPIKVALDAIERSRLENTTIHIPWNKAVYAELEELCDEHDNEGCFIGPPSGDDVEWIVRLDPVEVDDLDYEDR